MKSLCITKVIENNEEASIQRLLNHIEDTILLNDRHCKKDKKCNSGY